jgi:hypothetical protein
MNRWEIIDWLLQGDIAIQYQVYRDLLDKDRGALQNRIAHEGWGKQFLAHRKANGHWGKKFYQPKWTSTHYTLLDLRNLQLNPSNQPVKESIAMVLDTAKAGDGGIRLGPSTSYYSDVCVNGMFLNYASYFKADEQKLCSVVDSILNETMPDGGFNCVTKRKGARHSSLHSTISVLEGIYEFLKTGYTYRSGELRQALQAGEEFILLHQLFISDRTGKIINKAFLKLTYPSRWRYDILRALDYFQYTGSTRDQRMQAAIDILLTKRNADGTWNMQAAHPGKVHFVMEKAGQPSRINTLRAMRVLQHFEII